MTITRKNQFEELIDKMMIDEVSGLDEEIRATLEGLDTSKKRMAILSILDKDRDMFMKIKRIVDGTDVSKAEHIKNIVEMLREYVGVGEVEVKAFGEIMTPQNLVNDMLNQFPNSVWSNPDLKLLDPCSGVGVFSAVIVDRFMEGLKDIFPNEDERYAHIVENIIHVCELQPKNMFLHLVAFDTKDEYELNVYTGSFLEAGFNEHAIDVWGVDKFDIIIGNPPYNSGSKNRGSAHVLWNKFIFNSFKILKEGGYFSMVHPDGWRAVDGAFKDVQNLFKSKQMLYLELHNTQDGVEAFGVQTTYDFYVIRNLENNGFKTLIKFQDGIEEFVDLSTLSFIPNGKFKEIKLLMAKPGEEKVNLLRSCVYHTQKDYISKEKSETFKFPIVYTTSKDGTVKLRWSSRNDRGHFEVPKVIWSNGGATTPTIDVNGEYGITEFSYAIIDDVENLENIKKAMESVKFNELMAMTDGLTCGMSGRAGSRYNRKAISTFRKDFWKEFI